MNPRRQTRAIHVGNVKIGDGAPISVQSMTKTDTRDVDATLKQIRSLAAAGCQIVRLAVPDMEAAQALAAIKQGSPIPLIADIHFDWRLALRAIESSVDGLRINPGNIGAPWKVKEVVELCRQRAIPIRIGVNGGSLQKELLQKYGHPSAEAIVESAERHMRLLQDLDYHNFKVSLKGSEVTTTIEAYRQFSAKYDYPLHIGISEAGPPFTGVIKSSVGLGILLSEGIGDTMRVSLTAEPEEEVRTALMILRSLGLREPGADIISCPTCGRCQVDLKPIAQKVEEALKAVNRPIKVAVMGCAVNGPGEAREADIGIACAKKGGLLFKKGKVIRTFKETDLLKGLLDEIQGA
jgi:(E)-4-hydroxy-3-methylbut-2-enyl-diphosphate synthase